MNGTIKAVHHELNNVDYTLAEKFGQDISQKVISYHKSFPMYEKTPLVHLSNLANELGIKEIYVKDESKRFGLNAFKALGGSYCLGKYIADKLGMDISELDFGKITSPEIKEKLGEITFVTATDGNHGRGIAWTAQILGQKSVVYMPKGSAKERLENIHKCGAIAEITEYNYDDTVRFAYECAKKYGWVLVQDTAWQGYKTIPNWIMQGYTTMAQEAVEQLQETRPTHIFLQAGVGAMAGAIAGFFADLYKKDKPIITITEPNKADCFYKTAEINDGKLHSVGGALDTIMAGLACGEPCSLAWEQLSQYAENFVSMPDYVAAKGMRVLANPVGDDEKIISGESGASTTGFVAEIMQNDSLDNLRKMLKIDNNSVVLCFSTEGDTDKENYRKIVWDGLYPSF